LTGCTQLVEINEQQSNVLAEYMAGTVLRYDKNYKEALIYPDTAETGETEEISETVAVTYDVEDNTVPEVSGQSGDKVAPSEDLQNGNTISLENMFKEALNENFSITYTGYKFYESYPVENDFFTLEATNGKQLLVITFDVENTAVKTKSLDLRNYNLQYRLTNRKDFVLNPMMTLLFNDIQYINLGIAAGETQKAVILFDVSKDIDMSDMMLTITKEDKTVLLDLNQ